jgi:hypothetical protein
MKNQELELIEGLFVIEAEERLETIQISAEINESCCAPGGPGPGGSTDPVDGPHGQL